MGQAASDASGPVEPYYGVVIAPELLEQLDRRDRRKPSPPAPLYRSGSRPGLHTRSGFPGDQALQLALAESTRTGHLLLKLEEGEVEKIQEQAKDLIDTNYRGAAAKPVPCEAQRQDCIDCYSLNPQDPLQCESQVAAFSACAQQVRKEYMAAA
mmetsp:Transcript_33592/g.95022  ORF Transcript_33592/g.95022 Transcript_33592/m.95022 type:complete len:154 (-) Transcript_33592:108-569(-)|eukprot:CAMPEP_0117673012 /NCGR_PEP_ID=MMETSP0804-20121206/14236_1 /TAXON_ID=1074897 /ORGANISM="Tetraselmis astigmatica, Strain CCMP880" /LENGTH=153 /DNA_ID=CAMNT_0005481703 /DNA_START=314 /DNA_END=775 /DNA_ORIENTATION=-